MSLHTLAGHMAAKGRNSDSMLVHMTPGEVQSLQALAKAHGTSLTINPDTGLPEANILKKLLPALAGAALNYFAPGVGTAIGGALGLGSAAGAGIAIGGITSLATGSLSRGLMAGLGAYGGAGLTGTLMDAGTGGLAEADIIGQRAAGTFPAGAEEAVAAREAALSKAGSAGFMDKASAGMSQIASKPGMYGKDLLMSGAAAASPILADAMVPTTTGMPGVPQSDAYIRQKRFDPRSQTYADLAPVKASEWGERSFQSMAQGGIVALADGGMSRPPVTMEQMRDQYAASGGSPNYTPYAPKSMEEMNAKYPNTGGSAQAYDYLMGKGVSTLVPFTPAGQIARPYRDVVAGVPVDTSNQEYIFDPVTRTYKLNPNYIKPQTKEEKAAAAKIAAEKVTADKTAAAAALARQPSIAGISSGGGDSAAPMGPVDNTYRDGIYSLSGGLIPSLIPSQAPAPVDYMGTSAYQAAVDATVANDIDAVDASAGYAQAAAEAAAQAATVANDIDAISASEGFSAGQTGSVGADYGSPADGGVGGSPSDADAGAGGYGGGGGGFGDGYSFATGGMAHYAMGGISSLGGYSDGGQLLRGPGDGVSDSIPARIGKKQEARLADGEFVVPARIVSELGNGSTEAGARQLYAMMDRIQANRKKTVGKSKVAVNSRADKYLPA